MLAFSLVVSRALSYASLLTSHGVIAYIPRYIWMVTSTSVIASGIGCPLPPHQVPSLSSEHYCLVVSVSSGGPEQLAGEGVCLAELLGIQIQEPMCTSMPVFDS